MWRRKQYVIALTETMQKLFPRDPPEIHARRFISSLKKKTALYLVGILATVVFLFVYEQNLQKNLNNIQRNAVGGGTVDEWLMADVDNSSIEVVASISEKRLSESEITELFASAKTEIRKVILGENESLDKIDSDLTLPETLMDGLVEVEWSFDNYEVIDYEGKLTGEVKEGQETVVEVTADLSYLDVDCRYLFNILVFPKAESREEKLKHLIESGLAEANQQYAEEEMVTLPKEIDGYPITWKSKPEYLALKALLVLLPLAGIRIYHEKQKLTDMKNQRDFELRRDYSAVINQLTLLIGAGMTISRAWERVVTTYEKNCGGNRKYAYEEMRITQIELRNGVAETKAFEAFGKRCGQQRYVKLGNLLSQSISKGGPGLREALHQEALMSFEEQKVLARRLGEEAGTKLLLPMGLMLGVVLVIVVLPGIWSM